MKKLKWYYNHGKNSESFSVLYEKDGWILVKNDSIGNYSFGLSSDFGTLYGFPINQTSGSKKQNEQLLLQMIFILWKNMWRCRSWIIA